MYYQITRGEFEMVQTLGLFVILAFASCFLTLVISFFIVDHITFGAGMLRTRILEGLWNTGYLGHTIFFLVFIILVGIAELFKTWI